MLGKVCLTKPLSMSLWRNLVWILIQLGRFITAEQLCPQTTDDKTDNLEGSVGGQALRLRPCLDISSAMILFSSLINIFN